MAPHYKKKQSFREQLAQTEWSVVTLTVLGPAFLIAGALMVLYALHDPHTAVFKQYKEAVEYWETVGFFDFQDDFPHGQVHLLLNHSYIALADLAPGMEPPRPFRLNLNISNNPANLDGFSADLAQYTANMWFNGSLPIWPTWNGHSDMLPTQNLTITPFLGDKLTHFTYPAYYCSNVKEPVACRDATPVPHSPPPPHPQAPPSPPVPPAPPDRPARPPSPPPPPRPKPPPPAVTASARKLMSSSGKQCAMYYREMKFLTSVGMIVAPPGALLQYGVNQTHWHYVPDECASQYSTVRHQISQEDFDNDVLVQDGAWCFRWQYYFSPPANPPPLSVRSYNDPYVVAGQLTNCTFQFPPTSRHIANVGIGLIVPGMVMSVLAYFCLAGACSPVHITAADFGAGAQTPLTGGAARGARYGSTIAVELAAQRAADKRVM